MKKIVIAMVACVQCVVGRAQISLSEYQRRVENYSHTLAAAFWGVDGAEADLKLARKGYLPRLDASGDFSVNFRSQRTSDGTFIRPYS
ncbi:MAG: TolC family protein, partial [Rikenellaceae bacterium]|nr:TolC family protein [Rikenellaceae bacterium]